MNVATTATGPRQSPKATLVMACVGVFVAYLPVTSVSVSLPAIQRALHASTSQLSWISDAFVLPMAALILTAGVFGDVHGRKKVFQAGLLFAAIGAAVALSAQSVQVLWAGQALAGLGAAALLPTTLALISHAVPDPHERAKFVGLWAAALMTALAAGPLIAGVILEHAAWRWIYLPAIPVAVLTMAVAVPLVADSRAPGSRRLDWPGQIAAALAITSLVYGVIEGGADSFTQPRVIVALALAAAGALAFALAERRSASPMLDLALFRSPAFSATTLIAMISFLGLIGFFFVLSLYFGMVQRLGTLDAGYRLLAVTAVCLLVGVVIGPLMRRVSARLLITTGLLVTAGALVTLTALDAHTPFGALAWRLALLGLGLGLVVTPMTATAVAAVPHHLAGMAAAGNNAFRQVGAALGPAVLGVLLTTQDHRHPARPSRRRRPGRCDDAADHRGRGRRRTRSSGPDGPGSGHRSRHERPVRGLPRRPPPVPARGRGPGAACCLRRGGNAARPAGLDPRNTQGGDVAVRAGAGAGLRRSRRRGRSGAGRVPAQGRARLCGRRSRRSAPSRLGGRAHRPGQ